MSDHTPSLKKILLQEGCRFERQGKGDHEIWFSPITAVRFVVDGHIRCRHTANESSSKPACPSPFNAHDPMCHSKAPTGVLIIVTSPCSPSMQLI